MDEPPPDEHASRAIEAFADALHDLLSARARSWGLLDVGVEVDGWYIDGELLFQSGPDMGFSIDARAGACAFCELVGERSERWIDEASASGIDVRTAGDADKDALHEQLLVVLDGVLAARRPLLVKVDTPPKPAGD